MTLPSISDLCPRLFRPFASVVALFSLMVAGPAVAADAPADTTKHQFDLPAGDARPMLRAFATQANHEIVFEVKNVDGVSTNAVKGEFTAREALDRLLMNTGLVGATDSKTGAFAVRKETPTETKNGSRAAQNSDRPTSQSDKAEEKTLVLETFEVMGSKLLNMDKPRSRDGTQPYVIFDRTTIEQSGAANLEGFLKTRLTMNTASTQNDGNASSLGSISRVDLRGLGTNQTLILVDGRRLPSISQNGSPTQPDLNGIPLGAIERIEVLPTTASGIYGGGATGGAINIIMRRDYTGAEIKLTYDNSFNTDTGGRRVDINAGFTLQNGKTQVLVAGSYADRNSLSVQDRDFVKDRRAQLFQTNPNLFLSSLNPPPGTTTNIHSGDGSNLVLKNGTPLNSLITFIPAGYQGASVDGGLALVSNAGKYNLGLSNSEQVFGGGREGLKNGPTNESLSLMIRHEFNNTVQAFVEGYGSNTVSHFPYVNIAFFVLPANAPTNPFVQAVRVFPSFPNLDYEMTSRTDVRRAAGGIIVKLPWNWTGEADYTWGLTRFSFHSGADQTTALTNAISTGLVDPLRDTNVYPVALSQYLTSSAFISKPFVDRLAVASIRLAGPAVHLPAGEVQSLILLEHNEEKLEDGAQNMPASGLSLFPSREQSVDSAYLELTAPIVSDANSLAGVRSLELSTAVRWDSYNINGVTNSVAAGSTTPILRAKDKLKSVNPTISFRYEPVKGFSLRGSYGTGFLPPTVNQVLPTPSTSSVTVIDPRRGNSTVALPPGQAVNGGNPNLRPERSKTWSAGVVLTPDSLPGLRLSIDYTRITKRDNIIDIGYSAIAANEALYPGRVTRGPVPPGDPFGVGPIMFIDDTLANISKAEVEAYDTSIEYRKKTHSFGDFLLSTAATFGTHYKTQVLPTSTVVEGIGIRQSVTIPLKFKASAGLNWNYGNWLSGWNATYFDDYFVADPSITSNSAVIAAQGNGGKVPSQIYHDIYAGYRFPLYDRGANRTKNFLSGLEIRCGVNNLFNKAPPPSLNNIFGFYYSELGDPRLASYYISIKRQF